MMGGWSTQDEIKFIDGLGTGRFIEKRRMAVQKSRRELLEGYLQSAAHRKWDKSINHEAVIRFAKECLRQEIMAEQRKAA
jgi:hypothetical protein